MTVEDILARETLRDLVMRYCRGVDRRDFALVRSLYWDDAVDDHGDFFCGSPDDYVKYLPKALKPLDCTIHSISNSTFVIDGDVAEGEHYAVAFHRTSTKPRQEIVIHGRYLDRYERRDGIWKILHRKIVFDHGYVRAVAEKELTDIGSDTEQGSADENDPSWDFSLLAALGK